MICAGCGEVIDERESYTERNGCTYHRGTGCVLIGYTGEDTKPEIAPVVERVKEVKFDNEIAHLDRRRRWQLKNLAKGLCPGCSAPISEGNLCTLCRVKKRVQRRGKGGWKAWEKGKRGRPPMEERTHKFSL